MISCVAVVRWVSVAIAVVALLPGSAGGAAKPSTEPRLERTPPYVLGYCAQSKWLRLACPRELPHMAQPRPHWETTVCVHGRPTCRGVTWDDVELNDAGNGARPPTWSHIAVEVGPDLTRVFPFAYPTHGVSPKRLDGLFAKTRTKAIFVGRYTWGGPTGTVVLAPDFPAGGVQGGHLIFRWQHAGLDFAVGLHGWEPLSAALTTLRAVVRSI